MIAYDVEKRTLNLVGVAGKELPPEEIAAVLELRQKAQIKQPSMRKGLFKRYTEHALSAMEGAGY